MVAYQGICDDSPSGRFSIYRHEDLIMNDFNSRYRNIDDQPETIRTNAGGYGFDGGYDMGYGSQDMDIMQAENAQKKQQVARASKARGTSKGRKSKRQMLIYGIIIAIEVIALIVIWAMYISYNSKLSKGGSKSSGGSVESTDGDSANSGSINVENDNFSLACTKISITADAAGTPVAVVYFTFANKTDSPLSMSQVYSPMFKQAGIDLPTATSLAEEPMEISNKDAQVSSGQSVDCAYAVTLQDTTSEITITMHDNYETFSDIGSTVVPIS